VLLLADLVTTSGSVAATSSRRAKTTALAELLVRLEPNEIVPAVSYLIGVIPQGRIGVGWATSAIDGTAERPSVTVSDLDADLAALSVIGGPGSQAARRAIIDDLGRRLTPPEAGFVRRLLVGELRQGALAGVMTEAIAAASAIPAAAVRRAAMLSGDLAGSARLALVDGAAAIDAVGLTVGVGVEPMLASTAADVTEALAGTGPASVEWKLDGVRIQAHRDGDEVRLYTRNLNDVTDRLGAVGDLLRALPVSSIVLDGELLGIGEDGTPDAFQDSASSFGRRSDGAAAGLSIAFFDIVHLDGNDLLDLPLGERLDLLASVDGLPRIPSTRTDDPQVAQQVLDDALAQGHEGVMVKDLSSPYAAGRRGAAWRKIKPVHTLDLVVLAVEWGSGRRRGKLSNLHLGALDDDGTPVMVGKTFKGLTDELLAWQTERFLAIATEQDDHVVHVRPEQVVEIALDAAQASTRYPGGVALRFARVRRYRDDKSLADADTLDAVRALLPRSRRG
jgi:DNA ligase-1